MHAQCVNARLKKIQKSLTGVRHTFSSLSGNLSRNVLDFSEVGGKKLLKEKVPETGEGGGVRFLNVVMRD